MVDRRHRIMNVNPPFFLVLQGWVCISNWKSFWLSRSLARTVEQISYASRSARSRKQRSFCATAKYTGFGCAQEENNTVTVTGRSPEQPTAQIYSNNRNCHSSLDPCSRRSFKLSSCFLPSLVRLSFTFNVSSFSLIPIQNSSYKIRNGLGTNRETFVGKAVAVD